MIANENANSYSIVSLYYEIVQRIKVGNFLSLICFFFSSLLRRYARFILHSTTLWKQTTIIAFDETNEKSGNELLMCCDFLIYFPILSYNFLWAILSLSHKVGVRLIVCVVDPTVWIAIYDIFFSISLLCFSKKIFCLQSVATALMKC